ncbi:MAG: UDP-N-acetylmuramoyl-tripeptide--D-alanyl-D-alanine ligase [Patescibacteria group bacterium]
MNLLKKILVLILTLESRLIIAKYKPFIVAITGSVGKTSTKDAIYDVLKKQSKYVRKSEKSLNSEIGLPLTIIGVPNAWRDLGGWSRNIMEGLRLIFAKKEYPDCLILEIGADHPGDIIKVGKWLHPDISVITQISTTPVHVEFFSSPEEVFEEKAALAEAIKPSGTLVLFADNEKVLSLAGRIKNKDVKVISFGTVPSAQVRGSEDRIIYMTQQGLEGHVEIPSPNISTIEILASTETLADKLVNDSGAEVSNVRQTSQVKNPIGISFKLDMDGNSVPISVNGVLGKTYLYPLLAAAAVGKVRNIPISSIVDSLNNYQAPKGRMSVILGLNGSTLIDDSYNSSPDAVSSALQTLRELDCTGSKIVVLGDMMELGQYSSDEHRKIGREVVGIANTLVTVGQRSRVTADEAIKSGLSIDSVRSFELSSEAGEYLKLIVRQGDIVLIKGSQSVRMEKTVKILLRESEKSGELLVRQEKEWLDKK